MYKSRHLFFSAVLISNLAYAKPLLAQQSLDSTPNGGAVNSVQGPGSSATNVGTTALGVFATASGDRSVAIGPASAGGTYSVGIGNGANAPGLYEVSTGTFAGANNINSDYNTAVGAFTGNFVTGERNSSFGYAAGQFTTGTRNTALGANAGQAVTGDRNLNAGISSGLFSTGSRNVGLGFQAGQYLNGSDNVSIGNTAGSGTSITPLAVNNGVSIGTAASVGADNATAVGAGSSAQGLNSSAYGSNSNATAADSVAVGANSQATQANTVSFGTVGNERRLVNVAPGVAPTDGVNVSQLGGMFNNVSNNILNQANSYTDTQVTNGLVQANSYTNQRFAQSIGYTDIRTRQLKDQINTVQKGANQGVAAAVAMLSTIRTPSPGKSTINLGGGYYGGQSAAALSFAHRSRSSKWQGAMALGVPMSMVSGANVAAAAGIGYEF